MDELTHVWVYDDNKGEFVSTAISQLVCQGDESQECNTRGVDMDECEVCPGEPFLECPDCGAQYFRFTADMEDAQEEE